MSVQCHCLWREAVRCRTRAPARHFAPHDVTVGSFTGTQHRLSLDEHKMSEVEGLALPETGVWLDDCAAPELSSLLQGDYSAKTPSLPGPGLQFDVQLPPHPGVLAVPLPFSAAALRSSSGDSKQPGSPSTTDTLKRERVRAKNRAKSQRHREREKVGGAARAPRAACERRWQSPMVSSFCCLAAEPAGTA
jgi:hypothetical protein